MIFVGCERVNDLLTKLSLSKPYLVLTADDKDKLYKVVQRSVGIRCLLQLIEYDTDKVRYLDNLRKSELIKQSSWITESFRIEGMLTLFIK